MRRIAVAVALWLAAAGPSAATGFIALSDLHLDPTSDPALVPELLAAEVSDWAEILERGQEGFGAFGRDATWPLVRSALDQMRAVAPEPAFLLLTGDLLAHGFRAKFAAAAPGAEEGVYDTFVVKTVAFLAGEIRRRFVSQRVFVALGNNDDFCGDYMLTPDGAFLDATEPLVQDLLALEDAGSFAQDWDRGYGYDLPNGAIAGLRMIFLNSIFFAPGYDEACAAAAPTDPGLAAMDWLAGRLEAARAAGERVWLFVHIPPGADAYATVRHGACPDGLRAMWTAPETERFLGLMQRYSGTVSATFAGHTHMDEFRLLGTADAAGFVLVIPGISPIFGQNPGFQIYEADHQGRISDRDTWALTNLEAIGDGGAPAWRREYRFSARWGLPGVDATTLATLAARIAADPATRAAWYAVFRVGRTAAWDRAGGVASLPEAEFAAYHCAMTAVAPDTYRRCLCGG